MQATMANRAATTPPHCAVSPPTTCGSSSALAAPQPLPPPAIAALPPGAATPPTPRGRRIQAMAGFHDAQSSDPGYAAPTPPRRRSAAPPPSPSLSPQWSRESMLATTYHDPRLWWVPIQIAKKPPLHTAATRIPYVCCNEAACKLPPPSSMFGAHVFVHVLLHCLTPSASPHRQPRRHNHHRGDAWRNSSATASNHGGSPSERSSPRFSMRFGCPGAAVRLHILGEK
ncbi:hypothetical protein ZWY2020_002848 [Hordeum vulgare]|nr:hypothetical protein ZWY2020_002848 [Hordeum vulgare]